MTMVLCHGCFDVLHIGHLRFLQAAKKLGDWLVVSVTADAFINKGPGRPMFYASERAEMLRAIKDVDEVYISHEATGVGANTHYRPQFYVKGGDYKGKHDGKLEQERLAAEAHGGKLVILDVPPRYSSTAILKGLLHAR